MYQTSEEFGNLIQQDSRTFFRVTVVGWKYCYGWHFRDHD